MALAFVGFLSFALEVAWFFDDALRVVFGVCTLFWGVFCFPAWLLALGWRLGNHDEVYPGPHPEQNDTSMSSGRAQSSHEPAGIALAGAADDDEVEMDKII